MSDNGVKRFDRGALRKPVRLDNGWVRVDAVLTRTGVFEYRNADGSVRRELRLPEEVFKRDSLDTFAPLPFTDDHPPEMLNAANTTQFARGTVDSVRQDGNRMVGSLSIWSAETVSRLDQGKRELSCGYTCDLEYKSGEYDGQRYDAIQRNIRGNHVALVSFGRAGPEARVHMDTAEGVMVGSPPESDEKPAGESTVKFRIDGVEFEVSDQVAQALEKERAAQSVKMDAAEKSAQSAQASASTLQAKLDAAGEELKGVKQALAEAPAKALAAARARADLEQSARTVLGAEAKFDGKSDEEIKRAVLAKTNPDLKLDGRDAAYVQARFDIALETRAAQNPGLDALRVAAVAAESTTTQRQDAESARAKMIAENRDAWKKPLSVGFSRE